MASKPDPALHAALGRKMNRAMPEELASQGRDDPPRMRGGRRNFDDGGEVNLDEDSNNNAGLAPPTRASTASDTLQSLAAPSQTFQSPTSAGGTMQMPGQNQFGRMNDANVPNFPKINVVSNAYSPQMRGLPSPQARQQAAAAALAPFINALAKLKAVPQQ